MILPGHIAGGYLAAEAVLLLAHPSLPASQVTALLIVGTLAGEAPDIDLIWFYLEHRFNKAVNVEGHRDYVSHAPLVWLIMSLIIAVMGILARSLFTEYIGWMILVGSMSHFILDSIEYGVTWLWPFTDKKYAVRMIPDPTDTSRVTNGHRPGTFAHYWHFIRYEYWRTWTCYVEILISVAALCVLFHLI